MADFTPAVYQEVLKELVARLPSSEDAARVMLLKALKNTKGDGNEWGGLIFKRGNEYYALDPMTSGDPYNVRVSQSPDEPGDTLAGLYHTHPRGNASEVYSPADVQNATKYQIPSYIAFAKRNDMRRFSPGDKTSPMMKERGPAAKGTRVIDDLLATVTTPEERRRILQGEALRTAGK